MTKKHLDTFSIITLIIASYLMLVILGENILTLEASVRIGAFLLLLLLMSHVIIVTRAQLHDLKTLPESCGESTQPLIGDINYEVSNQKSDGLIEEEAPIVIGQGSSSQDKLPTFYFHIACRIQFVICHMIVVCKYVI